jgi:hypothetical protein
MSRITLGRGYVDVDINGKDPNDEYLILWSEVGPDCAIMKVYMSKAEAKELAAHILAQP